ncbi:hypothetical protein FPZ44_17925 [Paenibacillus agilis]|uniref:Uncharacterized protein n=1 Tax=Paenibacillus agilis TaxID=3020863 RepID=A0A559IPT9_9BACL|nr:hypothetical protein FPZ44_17925 [Paenibacillus agilis]
MLYVLHFRHFQSAWRLLIHQVADFHGKVTKSIQIKLQRTFAYVR